MLADDRDPTSHWALGRALWLKDRRDEALQELHTAIELSPNYAMGHYTIGWLHAQSGDPEAAIAGVDHARALSPWDPLLFAMLASRALALLRLGRYDEAAEWAMRSAARPNAHVHIKALAMYCLALAGKLPQAMEVAAEVRRVQPGYGLPDFVGAFKLGPDAQAHVTNATRVLGDAAGRA